LKSLAALPFRLAAAADAAAVDARALEQLGPAGTAEARLVFVNGHHRADLGRLAALPDGARVRPLATVLESEPELLRDVFDDAESAAFSRLNTATVGDGVLIEIDDDVIVDEPVALVFVGLGEVPVVRSPRVVIRAGRHARLSVIEHYLSLDGERGLTNVVTNLRLAAGARLDHHRLQDEAESSANVGRIVASVGENATFNSDSVVFGGALTRVDIDVDLVGRGARCRLNGLFTGRGEQHVDHHTTVNHAVPDTHSEELYRGILDGRSRGVFNGKVIVHRDAQQISARQASNNLLLSRQAEIDTKPELEIYADDVACAHGATVGELDPAALFYLRSRGVPEAEARALLTYAFAEAVVREIPLDGVRRAIEQRFIGHLQMSELREAMAA
ncbi:MAG: Fe-S cluster assembly protein SufD, partial [Gammaproteobacteria bacterium]